MEQLLLRLLPAWLLGPILPGWLRLHVVAEVEVGDDAVLRDFDTKESLATLPPRRRPVDADGG